MKNVHQKSFPRRLDHAVWSAGLHADRSASEDNEFREIFRTEISQIFDPQEEDIKIFISYCSHFYNSLENFARFSFPL